MEINWSVHSSVAAIVLLCVYFLFIYLKKNPNDTNLNVIEVKAAPFCAFVTFSRHGVASPWADRQTHPRVSHYQQCEQDMKRSHSLQKKTILFVLHDIMLVDQPADLRVKLAFFILCVFTYWHCRAFCDLLCALRYNDMVGSGKKVPVKWNLISSQQLVIFQLTTVSGHLQPPCKNRRFVIHCVYKHKLQTTTAAAQFTHSNRQHQSPSALTFCVATHAPAWW